MIIEVGGVELEFGINRNFELSKKEEEKFINKFKDVQQSFYNDFKQEQKTDLSYKLNKKPIKLGNSLLKNKDYNKMF